MSCSRGGYDGSIPAFQDTTRLYTGTRSDDAQALKGTGIYRRDEHESATY